MTNPFKHDGERGRFLIELGGLLEQGYELREAVLLQQTFYHGPAAAWLDDAYAELEKGELLSDQLVEAGFSGETVSFLRMMELFGSFYSSIQQAGRLLEQKYRQQRELRQVLYYPMFLILGAVVLAAAFTEGILPRFQQFYDALGTELPAVTRWMIFIVEWVRLPFLLSAAALAVMIYFRMKNKSPAERYRLYFRLPLLHRYIRLLLTYYFTAQLSPLLQNGLTLQEALKAVQKEASLAFFRLEAEIYQQRLEQGEEFSDVLRTRNWYLEELPAVWEYGELRGDTGREIGTYSSYLFNKLKEQTSNAVNMIQPAAFLAAGAVVLVLFLSMMLPVFSMMQSI
ncbi:competence type IV pilus assembly protein ComGB [Alkalicoccus chagannorensis]|uniref:competence type IV pilus assembly protein ComGB n=1 Tax=Alkalicoccus chagannorensis TaxID=427072 RepID=UPI00042113AD|nr:competence type IV pilus assembly protein ComGB [Alkalicoccus chagannorensis]